MHIFLCVLNVTNKRRITPYSQGDDEINIIYTKIERFGVYNLFFNDKYVTNRCISDDV